MKATVDWQGKMKFAAVGPSGHPVTMDAKQDIGGEDTGPRPMEMLLMGLGGCTGIDIVMILQKMRLTIDDFRVELNGDRAEQMPQSFTEINLHYILKGPDLTPDKVERAIILSRDKYCSAASSLNAKLKNTFELNGTFYEVRDEVGVGEEV